MSDYLIDVELLPAEAISLEVNELQQAAQLSHFIRDSGWQWQTYLNALALASFKQWLYRRGGDVVLGEADCTVLKPAYANAISAVCNLKANGFNVCLLTIGDEDEAVSVPRAAIDLPEFMAQFYVLIEIVEECEQALIRGFLRQDQLVHLMQSTSLQPKLDWSYSIPLAWFDFEPDRLLLHLRCSNPATIPLPAIAPDRSTSLTRMQAELLPRLPQLLSSDHPWWQILTWEQGVAVLTSPDLMDWLGEQLIANSQQPIAISQQLTANSFQSDLFQLLTQPMMNAGLWLRDRLDQCAQELNWMLLPPLAMGMRSTGAEMPLPLSGDRARSPVAELEAIVQQLERGGLQIPMGVRGAYRDWEMANVPLRLFIVTGERIDTEPPEWTLLVILGVQPEAELPPGIQLRVSDRTGVLAERILGQQTNADYLFAQVAGTVDERFLVTITLPTGERLTLPPFGFQPN